MKKETVKLTVNLPSKPIDLLFAYAIIRGITMSESIRRAIGLQNDLNEQHNKGVKILIERNNGKTFQLHM